MKIALLDVQTKKEATNKTMAGGFGTSSTFRSRGSRSWLIGLLEKGKKASVKVPLIEFAYLAATFKQKGHEVEVCCSDRIPEADLYIIYISLVEFNQEIKTAKTIRERYPHARIGFIGTLATTHPELVADHADFVLRGEGEAFFQKHDGDYASLSGTLNAGTADDLDKLPWPDWDEFRMEDFYLTSFFGRNKIYPVLTTRGCPFSCRYYCAYPLIAGSKVRYRNIEKVIEELKHLKAAYGAKAVIFRDANFSIDVKRAKQLCKRMIEEKLDIMWNCETHLSRLDKELLDLMRASGARAITVGIESRNKEVLQQSKRQDTDENHLEAMVRYCEEIGIKIMAGYIFGNLSDTAQSIRETIDYAKKLNTSYAQFYISTPYPGTQYYEEIKDRITTDNWERFDTYTAVFDHPNLSQEELENLKERAYIEYYFRPGWMGKFLRSKILDLINR